MNKSERANLIESISSNTLKSRIGGWARNVIANESKIRAGKGIVGLFDKVRDLPTVLVGAGPSLDKNVALLKEVKGKALIVAVDASLKPVLDIGVKPDIVVVADSKERVIKFFDKIDKGALKDVVVLADSFTHPKVIRKIESLNPDLFWYNVIPSDKSLFCQIVSQEFTGEIGFLGSGGCVTSIAFAFLTGGTKCDPIILIGKDCGYYKPDKHHASGALAAAERFPFQEQLVEDIYGNNIITNASLKTYAFWLEDLVMGNAVNGTFINCTEGGIVMRGWCIMPFRIAIDRYLKNEYNFRELLLNGTKDSSVNTSKKKQKAKGQEHKKDHGKDSLRLRG